MELTVPRKKLIETVSGVGQVAKANSTVPILECVKISVRADGYMVVTAFDLEVMEMRKFKIAEYFDSPFDFCVNPRDLGNILKTLRDEEVTLEVGENEYSLKHAKGCVSLPVYPAIDYPTIENETKAPKIIVDCETLYGWLKNASGFASSEKDKLATPVLQGVYLYLDGNEIGVAATDKFKLFADHITVGVEDPMMLGATVSLKAISPLLDMINGEENVTVYFGERTIAFRTSEAMLSSVLAVGKYPDTKRLIVPKDNPLRVTIDKEELRDSATRAMLSANAVSGMLSLTIEGNIMNIESQDLGFSRHSSEECPCEVEGGSIKINVKGSALMQCVNSIDSDKVVFEFSQDNPRASIMMYDDTTPSKSLLMMPLLLPSNQ